MSNSAASVQGLGPHELIEHVFKCDSDGLPIVRTAFLYGRPGTGKTSTAVRFAKSLSNTVFKVTLNDGDMAAKYEGFYVPKGDRFEYMRGVLSNAWTWNNGEGCPIVIDEIDHASSEVMSLLFAFLDDPQVAALTLPDADNATIHPGPKFMAIATSNQGPNALPEPLKDRFEVRIRVDVPSPGMMSSLIPEIRDVADSVIQTFATSGTTITFRDLKHYSDMRKRGFTREIAAQLCFGDKFADVLTAISLA